MYQGMYQDVSDGYTPGLRIHSWNSYYSSIVPEVVMHSIEGVGCSRVMLIAV